MAQDRGKVRHSVTAPGASRAPWAIPENLVKRRRKKTMRRRRLLQFVNQFETARIQNRFCASDFQENEFTSSISKKQKRERVK